MDKELIKKLVKAGYITQVIPMDKLVTMSDKDIKNLITHVGVWDKFVKDNEDDKETVEDDKETVFVKDNEDDKKTVVSTPTVVTKPANTIADEVADQDLESPVVEEEDVLD